MDNATVINALRAGHFRPCTEHNALLQLLKENERENKRIRHIAWLLFHARNLQERKEILEAFATYELEGVGGWELAA